MINLKDLVATIEGVKEVTISTLTDVKLAGGKKNDLQGKVKKLTVDSKVLISNDNGEETLYSTMVKQGLVKEGLEPEQYKPGKSAWGVRVGDSMLIEHKGEYYIECVFQQGGKSTYLVEGVETDKEDITGLKLTPDSTPKTQDMLKEKVTYRRYKLSSIVELTVDEVTYKRDVDFS